MGTRSLILAAGLFRLGSLAILAGLAGCPAPAAHPQPEPARPAAPGSLPDKIVADFEAAIQSGREAYVALFDFAAVGEIEILLHRYDLNGRLTHLTEQEKAQLASEDGTPYPAERERRNVGNFYKVLGQDTVGTGGCAAAPPRTRYGQLLGSYPPLPEGTPPKYETLRTHVNAWLAKGGVVAMKCRGGRGSLVFLYTAKDNARGYDLITIYDD